MRELSHSWRGTAPRCRRTGVACADMADPNSAAPFDLEALTAAIDTAVRHAFDTDEFRAAVNNAVTQFHAYASSAAGSQSNDSVASEIERAVTWPVNHAIAEAIGFDTLAQGTHSEVLRVHNAMQAVSGPIAAAIRETIRRPNSALTDTNDQKWTTRTPKPGDIARCARAQDARTRLCRSIGSYQLDGLNRASIRSRSQVIFTSCARDTDRPSLDQSRMPRQARGRVLRSRRGAAVVPGGLR